MGRGYLATAELARPTSDCLVGSHRWDVVRGSGGGLVKFCASCGELPSRNLGLVLPRRKPGNDRVCDVYGHDWEEWASSCTGLYSYCVCCGIVAEEMALETDPRTCDTIVLDPVSNEVVARYTPRKIRAKIENERSSTSAPALALARSGSRPGS